MKRIRKLTTAFLVIALLVTSLVSVPAFAADDEGPITRIAGDSRYLTAVEVSKEPYEDGADKVVLASGENFPDALAGSVLAADLDAPILLAKKDSIDAKTLAEIARLEATEVVVLGGEKAIDDSVLNVLTAKGYAVRRIAGENRYETAALIAKEVAPEATTVFLATGENYADALAIGPYAAAKGIPILLTTTDALHKDTAKIIKGVSVTNVVILGGEKAVGKAVVREIEEMGGKTITRIAGANREKTALAIAETYADDLSETDLIAVTGDNFADAVVGAYFGATFADDGSGALPIVLVRDTLSDEVDKYIRGYEIDDEGELVLEDGEPEPVATVEHIYIIGGPKAVSEAAEAELEAALLDLPPTVDPESAEFIKGMADGHITFTYKLSWQAEEVVVKFDDVLLDNELDDAIVKVTVTGNDTKLEFQKDYLNTLAVGEHTVAVTIDGHAMPVRKIKVTDPKEAVLNAEIAPEEVDEGTETAVVITLSGHYWDAKANEGEGVLKTDIVLAGAVVKLDNSKLSALLYALDESNSKVTIDKVYVAELEVGVHKVKIELADKRAVEVEFEVKAPEVAAGAYVTFDTAGEGQPVDEATMKADAFVDRGITIVGLDGEDYEVEKVALSFNGVKLTAGREYTIAGKVITLRKAFLERQDIGDYSIVVSYDGKALNALTLTIEEGAVDTTKSTIKIADEVVVQGIYDVAITLVDQAGNPVLHDQVVEVKLTVPENGVAKLSKNSDMTEGALSVYVRLNQGKATVYFQSLTSGTDFKIEVATVDVTFDVLLTAAD